MGTDLAHDPHVEISIRETSRLGRARVLVAPHEDVRARRLLLAQYRPRAARYRSRWGGDVERWGQLPLAVAVELAEENE
jgi:hypothetical protein